MRSRAQEHYLSFKIKTIILTFRMTGSFTSQFTGYNPDKRIYTSVPPTTSVAPLESLKDAVGGAQKSGKEAAPTGSPSIC